MQFEKSAGGILMPANELSVGGVFTLEHYREGELIGQDDIHNLVVNSGLSHMLNVLLAGGSQVSTWYLGLFENNYTPAPTTTLGLMTECIAYDEPTRAEYKEGTILSTTATNVANKAVFTMNSSRTIYGAFMASSSTKGEASSTLLAAARFSASKDVVLGDQLLLTYAFTASAS